MKQADWVYSSETAPAEYADAGARIDFGFRATSMKIKAGAAISFSFDGFSDHGELAAADGWQDFNETDKAFIYIKGGAYQLMAWSGPTA